LESFVCLSLPATGSTTDFLAGQVGSGGAELMGVPGVTWLGFILAVLLIGLVIFPAVWSHKPARRQAATQVLDRLIEVLDRLVRLLRPGSR
jgi:hypothetical protein